MKRFWDKVKKSRGCWEWAACKDSWGYGLILVNGRCTKAHRFSWTMKNGSIPAGLCVLHKCDNPACVRPSHLWLGTVADNNRDRDKKGRGGYSGRPGEKNSMAVFKEADVKAMRALRKGGLKLAEIGARFGVSKQTVWDITSRRRWTHI